MTKTPMRTATHYKAKKGKLSPREIEILALTACGKTRREIAKILPLAEDTVKNNLKKILFKLNAVNKTHAVSIATAMGIIALSLEEIRGASSRTDNLRKRNPRHSIGSKGSGGRP